VRRVFGVLAVVAFGLMLSACEPRPGKLRSQWQTGNSQFRIRVELYDEGNPAHMFERGCHMKMLSAPAASESWQEFVTAYDSRCQWSPGDRVRFVDERTAYVYLQWWYRVTRDGGTTWNAWDVPAHLPDQAYYNPNLIENVTIRPDGTGSMTLNPEGTRQKTALRLGTDDFGVTWTAK
jgi:hypothetical protein